MKKKFRSETIYQLVSVSIFYFVFFVVIYLAIKVTYFSIYNKIG